MIEIVGHTGGSEYKAAVEFKDALEILWPKLARAQGPAEPGIHPEICRIKVEKSSINNKHLKFKIISQDPNDFNIRYSDSNIKFTNEEKLSKSKNLLNKGKCISISYMDIFTEKLKGN